MAEQPSPDYAELAKREERWRASGAWCLVGMVMSPPLLGFSATATACAMCYVLWPIYRRCFLAPPTPGFLSSALLLNRTPHV